MNENVRFLRLMPSGKISKNVWCAGDKGRKEQKLIVQIFMFDVACYLKIRDLVSSPGTRASAKIARISRMRERDDDECEKLLIQKKKTIIPDSILFDKGKVASVKLGFSIDNIFRCIYSFLS